MINRNCELPWSLPFIKMEDRFTTSPICSVYFHHFHTHCVGSVCGSVWLVVISYTMWADSQFLSVFAQLGLGVGQFHRQMLFLLFAQPCHRHVSIPHPQTLPTLWAAHGQVPAPLLGLLTEQVISLLSQVQNHLECRIPVFRTFASRIFFFF